MPLAIFSVQQEGMALRVGVQLECPLVFRITLSRRSFPARIGLLIGTQAEPVMVLVAYAAADLRMTCM